MEKNAIIIVKSPRLDWVVELHRIKETPSGVFSLGCIEASRFMWESDALSYVAQLQELGHIKAEFQQLVRANRAKNKLII
jgi:hypothetical protein